MVSVILNFWLSFIAGVLAPLGAVCVFPLYPGFLAYLSNKISNKSSKKIFLILGLITTVGIIFFLFLFGLIFTAFFQASLTNIIGIISPIAFGILGVASLLLIFNINLGNIFPKINTPRIKNPYISSLVFGFFFGAIVLPCNPSSLIILFAVSTSTITFITNLINFVLFGIGMSLPILIFSILSIKWSLEISKFLIKNNKKINVITGIIMLIISLYYLFVVFGIHNLLFR